MRSPLRRVVNPLAADSGAWVSAMLVLVVVGAFLSYLAQAGPTWTPADGAPLSSLHLP